MQISSQIDQLIQNLNSLKPILSENSDSNTEKFKAILTETLALFANGANELQKEISLNGQNKTTGVPNWVDTDYHYDIKNSRKPNMRELIEAISGKSVEELYKEEPAQFNKITSQASEILYGVLGSNEDVRNWSTIMASSDILNSARLETANMYQPKVTIEERFADNGKLREQVAILTDKNEKKLTVVPNDLDKAEETLKNFGATHQSVPDDLENLVIVPKFDKKLLTFLQTFDKTEEQFQQVALQTAAENISRKLSGAIPVEELEKL